MQCTINSMLEKVFLRITKKGGKQTNNLKNEKNEKSKIAIKGHSKMTSHKNWHAVSQNA